MSRPAENVVAFYNSRKAAADDGTRNNSDGRGRSGARWITPIVFGVGSGAIIVLALGLVIAFRYWPARQVQVTFLTVRSTRC